MARSDELMREIRDEVALTREEVRLSREQRERSDAMMERRAEQLDRYAAEHSDFRSFMQEMTRRVERSGNEVSEALRAHTAEFLRTSAAGAA